MLRKRMKAQILVSSNKNIENRGKNSLSNEGNKTQRLPMLSDSYKGKRTQSRVKTKLREYKKKGVEQMHQCRVNSSRRNTEN
jgi:hypothetical protein